MPYSPQNIQAVKLFQGLAPLLCLKLFDAARRAEYPAGKIILQEGELGDTLYAVLQGKVEVKKKIDHQSDVLAHLGVGDVFGEMALLEGKTRSATVTALEPATLLCFPFQKLQGLFEQEPRIGYKVYENLARLLSERLRQIQGRGKTIRT